MTTTNSEGNQPSRDGGEEQTDNIDRSTLIEVVSNLADPRGGLMRDEMSPQDVRARLQSAAEAAGLDLSPDADTATLTTAGHPDDGYFLKHGHDVTGTLDIGPIYWEIDDKGDSVEDVSSWFRIAPSSPGEVKLETSIEGTLRGWPFEMGGLVTLSPEQADGLAAGLMEAAVDARDGGRGPYRTSETRVENALDAYEVSRDDYGSTRIEISEELTTHVYDEGEPDTITIDPRTMDKAPLDRDDQVNINIEDARRLRDELDEALSARRVERDRYDDLLDDD